MDRKTCLRLFESRLAKGDGCWIHSGSRASHGYPQATGPDGRTTTAHRLSWTLYRGPIPAGAFVCHRCDNKLCANPDHLYVGTHADNMRDMRIRERNIRKINRAQAASIREDRRPQRVIARDYGVHQATVRAIKIGRTHY